MEKYFDLSSEMKTKIMFAKLVKNDDHVEFAKCLYYFLNKKFKAEINWDNKSQVNIQLLI